MNARDQHRRLWRVRQVRVCGLGFIACVLLACGSERIAVPTETTPPSTVDAAAEPTTTASTTTTSTVDIKSSPEPTVTTTENPETEFLATTPDGRFTYYAEFGGGRWGNRWQIMVESAGDRVRALRDDRDLFDEIEQFVIGDQGLVGWVWVDYNYGYRTMVGRIDANGRIVDTHPLGGEALVAFVDDPNLATIIANAQAFGLDLAADPYAVTSANPTVLIDTTAPLTSELETNGFWARDDPGSWYLGETLSRQPACGGSTLYKDDADGFARVLAAEIELDTVVEVHVSEADSSGAVDSAGIDRFVVLSTECPEKYQGRRVFVGREIIGYGDRGPRFEFPLTVEPLADFEVSRVVFVEALPVTSEDCCGPPGISVQVELLNGKTETISWP